MRRALGSVLGLTLAACTAPSADEPDAATSLPDAGAARFVVTTPSSIEDVAVDAHGNVFARGWEGTLYAWRASGEALLEVTTLGTSLTTGRHTLAALDDGVAVVSEGIVRRVSPGGAIAWETVVEGACAVAEGTDGTIAVSGLAEVVVLDAATGSRVRALPVETPMCRRLVQLGFVAGGPGGTYVTGWPLRVFDAAGDPIAGRGEPELRELHAMAVAPDGAIVLAGVYERVGADFPDLPQPLQFDPVVLVYEPDATPRFAVALTGMDFEYAYGLAVDEHEIRITGHYGELGGALDVGDVHLDSDGERDAFLVRIGMTGEILGADALHGDEVVGRAVAASPSGTWVVGGFLGITGPGTLRVPGEPPLTGSGFVYAAWP